jgi:hypothetical protein
MAIEFLNPTHEADAAGLVKAKRLGTLEGATVAIISNGKKNTKPFFDAMADELRQTHKVADVVRITKSNYSAPVEPALLAEAEKWQAIISGIGD